MKNYEILEHRTDFKIRAMGQTKEELFENAMVGMFAGARYQAKLKTKSEKRKISIKSLDLTSLLVDFLNEVLYLSETKWEVYSKVDFQKLNEKKLEATLSGQKLKRMGVHIKAVTYYGLDLRQKKDKTWQAIILFDI